MRDVPNVALFGKVPTVDFVTCRNCRKSVSHFPPLPLCPLLPLLCDRTPPPPFFSTLWDMPFPLFLSRAYPSPCLVLGAPLLVLFFFFFFFSSFLFPLTAPTPLTGTWGPPRESGAVPPFFCGSAPAASFCSRTRGGSLKPLGGSFSLYFSSVVC